MDKKLKKSDYTKIAKIYIKTLLEQNDSIFTDRYFNTKIENEVNVAIDREKQKLVKQLKKSINLEIKKFSLDDIIDEYCNLKFNKKISKQPEI